MAIEMTVDGSSEVQLRHFATPPLVYLDHWALGDIAEQCPGRFVEAMLGRNGTLGLSWVNFVELSESGPRISAAIRGLLRQLIPENVVFVDDEAGAVAAREDEFLAGCRGSAPFLHTDWLNLFFTRHRQKTLDPLSPDEFLEWFEDPAVRSALANLSAEAAKTTNELIESARGRASDDPEIQKRLRRFSLSSDPRTPPTRHVFIEAMRYLVKGQQDMSTGNHLRDFWHTVVPISYFDYVVLDKNWKEAARQIQNALRPSGRLTHEASVYCNLDEFLWHLENEITYNAPPAPPAPPAI